MIKIKSNFYILILLFSGFLFFLTLNKSNTNIVKADPPVLGTRSVCLRSYYCMPRPDMTPAPFPCARQIGHRAMLIAETNPPNNPPPNVRGWVQEVFQTPDGEKVVTGESVNEAASPPVVTPAVVPQYLITNNNYIYQGMFAYPNYPDSTTEIRIKNPVRFTPDFKFIIREGGQEYRVNHIEWQSATRPALRREFKFTHEVDESINTGGTGGQQLGTGMPEGGGEDCVAIRWDPFGKVFDSQTLEPLIGTSVLLEVKKGTLWQSAEPGSDTTYPLFINPYITTEDGSFTFIVNDGTYRLRPALANYVFPNNPTLLAANAAQIYPPIYTSTDGVNGDNIIQAGMIQQRNIPMDRRVSSRVLGEKTTEVKLLGYAYNINKSTNMVIVQGDVSYPLARVNIYSRKLIPGTTEYTRGRFLAGTNADNKGYFKIQINQNSFIDNEVFGEIELGKINLTGDLEKNKTAPYQTNLVKVQPIFNNLDGYSYDAKNNIIPNAKVEIYDESTNKVFYTTQADEKGYFKVSSEFLPKNSYTIKYTPAVKGLSVVTTDTSKFLAQNADYIATNKVNLGSYKNQKGETVVIPTPTRKSEKPNGEGETGKTPGQLIGGSISSNMLLYGVIILVLVGVVVGILGIYLLKKNQNLP